MRIAYWYMTVVKSKVQVNNMAFAVNPDQLMLSQESVVVLQEELVNDSGTGSGFCGWPIMENILS